MFIGLLIAMFLVDLAFAVAGALIVTRKSGHLVGWLLLFVAISNANPIPSILEFYFPAAPAAISPCMWLKLWFNGWAWSVELLLIFLILLNFPTGRPPSRSWRWLNFTAPAIDLTPIRTCPRWGRASFRHPEGKLSGRKPVRNERLSEIR